HEADMVLEGEFFEDATDQGSIGTFETDMEVVQETSNLGQ
ncbi:hypothetical protein L195_g064716, partial [Trifolium pratense]